MAHYKQSKLKKMIRSHIFCLSLSSLAMISPLFMAEKGLDSNANRLSSYQGHLTSSSYRKVSSIESSETELSSEEIIEEAQNVCAQKKKIEDLSKEIEKLQKEKEKVERVLAKLETPNKEKSIESELKKMSEKDILSQLLLQQIYTNQMLSHSYMNTPTQSPGTLRFGDATMIIGNHTGSLSSQALNNYAGMALYNQMALGIKRNQSWSPQFNANGSLSNGMYDTNDQTSPYHSNSIYADQYSVYNTHNLGAFL